MITSSTKPAARLQPKLQALPDPWAASRRSLLMGLLGVGILAALLALAAQWPAPDPVDLLTLPLVMLVQVGLLFGLWRRRVPVIWSGRIAYVSLAAYFLLSLNYQLFVYAPRHGHLSEATYWFTVVYCTAFVAWRRRAALSWAGGTYALVILSLVAHAGTLAAHPTLLPWAAQFAISGLASIVLLNHLTVLQQRYGEARLLAYADFLTGLPNRRCGEEILAQELRRGGPLTVALFDIDHFKGVNDRFGHDVGDVVLREAARLTAKRVRGAQQVFRWGGEEFLLVMPRTDKKTAEQFAERIRTDIAEHTFEGAGHITASFGLAVYKAGDDPDQLVKRADANLYRAKERGRNRVQVPTTF